MPSRRLRSIVERDTLSNTATSSMKRMKCDSESLALDCAIVPSADATLSNIMSVHRCLPQQDVCFITRHASGCGDGRPQLSVMRDDEL